jgi:hypothetical protein
MTLDPEMELWRKEWSRTDDIGVSPTPREILASITNHRRRANLALGANVTFAILLLAASFITAKRMHSLEMVLWAVCVWIATLVATFISLEGWQRSRVTNTESVADYVAFRRKTAFADQWKVRAGLTFLVVQLTITCAWLTIDFLRDRIPLIRFEAAMLLLFVFSATWVYVFIRTWRRSKVILETTTKDDPDDRSGVTE